MLRPDLLCYFWLAPCSSGAPKPPFLYRLPIRFDAPAICPSLEPAKKPRRVRAGATILDSTVPPLRAALKPPVGSIEHGKNRRCLRTLRYHR